MGGGGASHSPWWQEPSPRRNRHNYNYRVKFCSIMQHTDNASSETWSGNVWFIVIKQHSLMSSKALIREGCRVFTLSEQFLFAHPYRLTRALRTLLLHQASLPLGFWTSTLSHVALPRFAHLMCFTCLSVPITTDFKKKNKQTNKQQQKKTLPSSPKCLHENQFLWHLSELCITTSTVCFPWPKIPWSWNARAPTLNLFPIKHIYSTSTFFSFSPTHSWTNLGAKLPIILYANTKTHSDGFEKKRESNI